MNGEKEVAGVDYPTDKVEEFIVVDEDFVVPALHWDDDVFVLPLVEKTLRQNLQRYRQYKNHHAYYP